MLKNISNSTFSGVLTQLMNDKEIDVKSLSSICEQNGKYISIRNIHRYKSGEVVPSLEDCLFIINCLSESVSINELNACLNISKDYRNYLRYKKDSNKIRKNITIEFDEFNYNIEPEELISIISDKVNSRYPNSNKAFSLYIRDLIANDIKDDIPKN